MIRSKLLKNTLLATVGLLIIHSSADAGKFGDALQRSQERKKQISQERDQSNDAYTQRIRQYQQEKDRDAQEFNELKKDIEEQIKEAENIRDLATQEITKDVNDLNNLQKLLQELAAARLEDDEKRTRDSAERVKILAREVRLAKLKLEDELNR